MKRRRMAGSLPQSEYVTTYPTFEEILIKTEDIFDSTVEDRHVQNDSSDAVPPLLFYDAEVVYNNDDPFTEETDTVPLPFGTVMLVCPCPCGRVVQLANEPDVNNKEPIKLNDSVKSPEDNITHFKTLKKPTNRVNNEVLPIQSVEELRDVEVKLENPQFYAKVVGLYYF